jgi:hypothetical protein
LIDEAPHAAMYAIGAFFCDRYGELVEDVLADADAIERVGLRTWARTEGVSDDDAYEALITGLSIRFYTAVAGERGKVDSAPSDGRRSGRDVPDPAGSGLPGGHEP